MRIGFDAKRITHNPTGLGNYARFVLAALAANCSGNEYYLYSIDCGQESLYSQLQGYSSIHFRYPSSRPLFPSLWRSFGIIGDLCRDKIDLYHGLSNELPLRIGRRHIPSVVTIHDLIYLRYPQTYRATDRFLYSCKYRNSCREADRIIAASRQTKQDIVNYWEISEDKIDVVYQGCNPIFYREVTEKQKYSVRRKYDLNAPYILYVGTIEERKNLLTLVRAFHNLNRTDIDLVVIGRPTHYFTQVMSYIKEKSLHERIKICPAVSHDELPVFYQMAEVFVYPSRYEGFGIPVLEALVSNVPVITATGSCLEETGGPASLYADPDDSWQFAAHIQAVLNTPALASRMKMEGRLHAEQFAPGIIASRLMDVYKHLL
ncbi:MAG: glycosyltransferase family 4 protein [Tannerellaceae bacterium]|jgi:glycosyltransferase involved in cell wall biosynthesis|nr:glycosyltransferase family 4 protein [Tannerellaceae bacterium]